MNWHRDRELARGRLIDKYDSVEAKSYDSYVGTLSDDDEAIYLADIQAVCPFSAGESVLDVGAGSGTLSKILTRVPGLALTALEPSPSMREILRSKPELANLRIIPSGCDRDEDRDAIAQSSQDVIVMRQVVNSLFDPLLAFRNWFSWLKPGGRVIIVEGVYTRDGWSGIWQEEVDVMPLSATQSLATIPYLLESVGFQVTHVDWMSRTNQLASTRTKRYLVVAFKPSV